MKKFLSFLMMAVFSVSLFAATSYTVAGSSSAAFGTSWDPANEKNDMTLVDGVYTLVKEDVTLAAGTIEYKVCENHTWDICYPSSNAKLQIAEGGKYTLTFTFVESTQAVNATAQKTEEAQVDPKVSIKGGWDSWAEAKEFTLASDKKSATLVMAVASAATYEFKVIVGDGDWRSDEHVFTRDDASSANITGNSNTNMKLTADVAGDYTFTWTFASNTLVVTFPEKGGDTPEPPAAAKFYITGDSALVVDAGLEATKAWNADAIKSMETSYKLNLKANVDYKLKVTVDGTWNDGMFKGFGDLTTTANGLTGDNDGNICFKLNTAGEVNVHYDGEYFFLNGDFYVAPAPEQTYYLKNNWEGAQDWTWKEMTKSEDGTYMLVNVVFGGIGVNISTDPNEETPKFIEMKDIETFDAAFESATLGALDTVVFMFDPEEVNSFTGANGLTAQILGKYVEPVIPTTPVLYDTLYFVNTLGWATPYGYYWPIEVSNWPGQELKKTEDKVGNYDVYMFVAPVEKISNCVFNDGASENIKQTVDLAPINNDKYFVPSNEQDNVGAYKGTWYATLDAITGEQLAAGFYLIGQKGWTVADLSEDLKFAETTTANVYSLTVTLAKDQEIKAVYVNDKGEIANWMPNGDNFVVTDKYAGEKTVLLNVTGKGGEDWFEGYLYVEPNPDQPIVADGFYLVGSMTNWAPKEGYLFAANPDNEGEYMITATLAADDAFKVVKVENGAYSNDSWYPGEGGDYVVDAAHAGEKTIYFRPDYKGGEDWYYGCIYIAPNEDQPVAEWAEIIFTAATAADATAKPFNDSVFTVAGSTFSMKCSDAQGKMAVDANNATFGTKADGNTKYTLRLKTMGKTGSSNFMTLTIPADGILRFAALPGGTSDERTVVMKQGDDEIYNQVITSNKNEDNYYDYRTVNVKQGTLTLTYPVNGINFYSFAFKAGGDTPEPPVAAKFYITGDSALVVDAGLEATKAWSADAIKSMETSYKLNLKANVDYKLKVTLDGTWNDGMFKGFGDLTTTANGLTGDNDGNICFKLNTAGEVNVHYDGEFFFLNGDFYVAPAPEQTYYLKNNWEGAQDWTWKAMTKEDGYYSLANVVFGGTGVNISNDPENDGDPKFIEMKDIETFDAAYEPATLGALDTVVFMFDPEAVNSFTGANGLTALIIGKYVEPVNPPTPTIADGFYLVGTFNSWTPAEGYLFAANPNNEGEYMITATLAEKDEFKAVKVENGTYNDDSWYPKEGGNYVVDAARAGEKVIYFRPEGNTDWGGNFYIAPNEAPEMTVIYDWAGEIGATIFGGNSGITTGTVKIHKNTDNVNGIKFGSSYVYADGKWIAIKPAEGGFKAGDVLSVSVVFNNSDATKYCMVDLRAADGDTRIWMSDSLSTLNGRNEGEPIVQTYTLEADQDSLFLGRYGNTGMFVTLLKVERAAGGDTPAPEPTYYLKNNWEGAQDWTWKAMTKEDGYYSLANVVFGGTGVNISTDPNEETPKFIEMKDIETFDAAYNPATLGALDTVVFFFDPEEVNQYTGANGLTAQIIGKYVEPVIPPTPDPTVVVIGDMNNWDENDPIAFTLSQDKKTASLVVPKIPVGDYNFKLKINGEWRSNGWWFNRNVTSAAGINSNEAADMRLQADVEGQYTFTWTFANDSLDIIFPAKPDQPALADGFYFVGTANNWTPAEGYMFSKNPDNEGEYMFTTTLAENDEFKAVKVENGTYNDDSWYPAAGGNYVVDAAHAGEKTIYFRPEGNTEWGGCFYIAPNGDQPIEPGEFVDITLVPGVWNIADAKFAAVTLNKVPEGTFDMTSVIAQATFSEWFVASSTIEGAYVGKIPADTKIIAFGRFAPETEIPSLEAVMSVNFWNHSDMLEIDASMKYTIDGWPAEGKDYCPGHWGDLPTIADGFYFVGTANEWTPAEGYMFSKNPDNEGEYMFTTTLAAGDEFKVVYVENGQKKDDQWYPGGEGGNYVVDAAHAGEKTIYFRPDYKGGEDWYYGCIFVPANSGEGFEEIIATGKAAKIIRNGQFFIIKGDKMYNVTGAKIR